MTEITIALFGIVLLQFSALWWRLGRVEAGLDALKGKEDDD